MMSLVLFAIVTIVVLKLFYPSDKHQSGAKSISCLPCPLTSSQRDLALRALHKLRNFLATWSEELELNNRVKIMFIQFVF